MTIIVNLFSIYPKHSTDTWFIQKMITLAFSVGGLIATFWYPDEVDYLEEY